MGLEALELVEGRQVRVLVVEPDDVADVGLAVLQMIDERAAPGLVVHRPARAVDHQALLVLRRVELPELLEAEAVGLGVGTLAQAEMRLQLLRQGAVAALAEEGVLPVQLHPRLEAVLLLAVAADAEDAGGDPLDPSVVVKQHLGRGKAGIDLGAQGLGLLRQPATDVAQRHDVVALVVQLCRQGPDRHREGAFFAQHQELLGGHRAVQRGAFVLPVRDQLVQRPGVEDRAGEDMRADLGALFQNADADLPAGLGAQLAQADRRGQTCRSGADDHHVVFHRLSFHPPYLPSRSAAPGRGPAVFRSFPALRLAV